MTENEILQVALEEYRSLWSYYHRLLEEWKNFIDWYFKVVTLPAGVLGYLAINGPGSPDVPGGFLAAVLGVVALVGFSLYIGYSKEARNGFNYEVAMAAIRSFLSEREPILENVLRIDALRASSRPRRSGSIKFWRGFSMAIINSGLGAGAVSVASQATWLLSPISFALFLALHIWLFRFFTKL